MRVPQYITFMPYTVQLVGSYSLFVAVHRGSSTDSVRMLAAVHSVPWQRTALVCLLQCTEGQRPPTQHTTSRGESNCEAEGTASV